MAARAAFGRAMVAAGGTMLFLGGATMVVSFVGMTVTKMVLDQSKKKQLVMCKACCGHEKITCGVCEGERVLRYHPMPNPPINAVSSLSACALCGGTGQQTCPNCLGEGKVMPLNLTGLDENKLPWIKDEYQA